MPADQTPHLNFLADLSSAKLTEALETDLMLPTVRFIARDVSGGGIEFRVERTGAAYQPTEGAAITINTEELSRVSAVMARAYQERIFNRLQAHLLACCRSTPLVYEPPRRSAIEVRYGNHPALARRTRWKPIGNLRTIFHDGGHFAAPDGRRFDYIFPELLRDPALPRKLIPRAELLERSGVEFVGRYTTRREEALCIGFNRRVTWLDARPRSRTARSAVPT